MKTKNKDLLLTIAFTLALLSIYPFARSIMTLLMVPDVSSQIEMRRAFSISGGIASMISAFIAVPLGFLVRKRAWLWGGISASAVTLVLCLGSPMIVRFMGIDFLSLIIFSIIWATMGHWLRNLRTHQKIDIK